MASASISRLGETRLSKRGKTGVPRRESRKAERLERVLRSRGRSGVVIRVRVRNAVNMRVNWDNLRHTGLGWVNEKRDTPCGRVRESS
jgi:hypothetical protein